MSVSFSKFQPFVEKLAEKTFNLQSDTLKVALTNSAPAGTESQLSQITEISYTNLSARTLTVSSSAQTSGTYKLVIADLTLTATGAVGPFRYIVIYDDTATNDELIGYYDYGSNVTMASGDSFPLDFDGSAGLFTLV